MSGIITSSIITVFNSIRFMKLSPTSRPQAEWQKRIIPCFLRDLLSVNQRGPMVWLAIESSQWNFYQFA
jgi:hypothetical protein